MTPLQSPTSPTFDSYPTTPLTPTFAHTIDSHVNSPLPSPRLRVVTSFPFQQMQLLTPVATKPQNYSGLKALHKRNSSSASTLSFPSPADAFFNNIPPTPKTPVPNVPFRSMLSPGGPAREDGRQSRMAMRSPILERILTLPIRLSTSARTPPSETRFPNPPNSMASPLPFDEDDMAICSPFPFPFPQQTPTPTIQISSPSHRRTFSTTSTLINTSQAAAPRRIPKRPLSPPPHYHMKLAPSLSSTLNNNTPLPPPSHFPNPAHRTAYTNAITHLSTPLVPLISVTSGLPHPEFPRSLLQYHLLTHAQLDDLARWYHQTQPACAESWMYPAWIPPYTDREAGGGMGIEDGDVEVELGTKRRRWGRFIGLRGCESPTATGYEAGGNGSGCGIESENREGLVERMEREWLRARERAREEEIAREKGWRGRW